MVLNGDASSGRISGINVTPLVDVSLVLVLVFMVSSPYFMKSLLPVSLPKAVSTAAEDQKNVTVSLSQDGTAAVNENQVDRKALAQALRRRKEETGFEFLLIRADKNVPHGDVEDVMRTAKRLGFNRIAFATEPGGW